MRLLSLAQLALLGTALTLASCENKQADSPSTESSSAEEQVQLTREEALARGSVPPSSESPYKRYGIQRAHVHYEVSGFRRGVEDLYFDNWGRKEARHINVEDLTEQGTRPAKNIIVTNGSYMQMADLIAARGNFMTEPVVDSLMKLKQVDPAEVISDSIMSRLGYKRQGEAPILGIQTNVWHEVTTGTTLYAWKGIVLKQEVKTPQHHHMVVAVSIDTTSPIPDSTFMAQKGIEYSPMPPRPGPGGPPKQR